MSLRNFAVDVNLSLGATATGAWIPVDRNIYGFSIAAIVTGASSPVGVLKVQTSIDPGADPVNATDFAGSERDVSTNQNEGWDIIGSFRWVRVAYTRTSGSATLNTIFNENY